MMAKSYKCSGCGAPLVYEEGTDHLVCPYCETTIDINTVTKSEDTKTKQTETAYGTQYNDSEMKRFHCTGCGGELETDAFTAATICPFCGSPVVLSERLSGSSKPDVLIPFSINREQAREMFRSWTKSGLFTPRGFSSEHTLDSITGLYVPYWFFGFDTMVHMEADATRVRVSRKGDWEYIYTDHYRVIRDTRLSFHRLPADASDKMPDETMELLEPYEYEQIKTFEMPYLAGYFAECSNHEAEQFLPRAKERAQQYAVQETRGTIDGYASVNVNESRVHHHLQRKEYAMLPVWVLTYRYQGKNWQLYLNGQSGKKIGSLPISKGRVAACYGMISAALTIISALIWRLL